VLRTLVLPERMLDAPALVLVVEGGNTNEEKGDAVRLESLLVVDVRVDVGSLSLSATPPNKLEILGLSLLADKGVVLNRDAISTDFGASG